MAADQSDNNKSGKMTVGGVMSPNVPKKPLKERVPFKPDLKEINVFLKCSLCIGYLIDATAIQECHHTFCKSCIMTYLKTHGYCPICDVGLNTVKPSMSLRSDVIIQRLVYKLVPGLLVSELRRRKAHEESKNNTKAAESVSDGMVLELDAASDVTILSLDDVVSLSIEYFRGSSIEEPPKVTKITTTQIKSQEQKPAPTISNLQNNIQDVSLPKDSSEANDRRYLKCPAAVSVGLLKKFIKLKYDGLSDDYRVDLLYNGVRDNSLENDLTLLDVAFIYKWNKAEPMRFHYRIFDRNVKSLPSRSGTKRSASSMMDEPPDDDAAPGPQNRPPMTSASPTTKIPRVSNNTSTGASNNRGNTGGSYRSTSNISSSTTTPVYDFSEGNSDHEESMHKGKLKLRAIRKENNNSSSSESSKSISQALKRLPPNSLRTSYASRSQSYESKAIEVGRSDSGSGGKRRVSATKTYRGRSSSVGTSGNDVQSEDEDSDSSTDSDEAKNTDLTNSRVRSAAQTVMQSQVNGIAKLNMSSSNVEKREPLKLSLGSVMAKSPEHKHKHKHHHKLKHKKKHKPLKLSLSLNPVAHASVNSSHPGNHKSGGNKLVKVSGEKGTKLIFTQNKVKGTGNGSSGSANSQSNFPVNVKPATSAHLSNISKSISVSIGVGNNQNNSSSNPKQSQFSKMLTPTSLHMKNTGNENKQQSLCGNVTQQSTPQTSNSSSNPNQSTSRSHPLLPESVHVPKSVTLIPVNPNGISAGRGSSSGNVAEKSGPTNNTPNRLNAHTFTHPITNKSLHQITVTEVPPPPKSGSPAIGGGSIANNSGSNTINNAPSNPIEKVIANAVKKPQFQGPGSMEITKIYCNTKENPAKKLKERKGLDISISVPGMKEKKPNKLEESLRQKVGAGTTMTIHNKIKGNSQPPAGPIFNAKMPPGITIGPAGMNKTASSHSNSSNSANIIPGLGFSLPPQITAHPQNNAPKGVVHQGKQNEKMLHNKNLIGNNNKNQIVMNKMKDNNSSSNMNKAMPNKGFDNRKQLGEALASMIDMANRNSLKSPSPPKNCQQNKDNKALVKATQPASVNCEKRALDMSSSSRKNSRDSPEPKRSKTNDSSNPKTSSNESPLDLSGRSSRPNSNSSSPTIHQIKVHSNSSPTLLLEKEKHKHQQHNNDSKKSQTPVPKVSPPAKSTSQKPTTPTGSSSPNILSIAQSLAQKQLSQQQQQQQQNLHNQIMQLHQGLQNMHATHTQVVGTGKRNSLSPKGASGGGGGNMNMGGSSGSSHKGLNSLSPPIISMPNPSPPGTGFDPLRNLLTLSDCAVRHAKVHPMNNLMAAVGLQPPHTHHGPSPTFPHLVNSLSGKSPNNSLMDPHSYLAAISAAHNERLAAAAANMTHFGDTMNPFFSQVRPPSNNNPHGSLIRIPSVTPKTNSCNNNKKTSPTPPHSPTKPSSSPVSTSSSSSTSSPHSKSLDIKSTKINGTSFILPPGIHNPLLPNYSRNASTTTNPISSSATNFSNKVISSSSDKKGIPNSMKISNFLPNKPKDGKGKDTANVEATITSGSNVGGSSLTSIAKFLNSIPPLMVSQAQSNLSVSPSTLPKDSSRAFSTLNNKSSNEQESLSKPKLLSSSSSTHTKTLSCSNPIKKESEKGIITSSISAPLKSSPPATCQSNSSTPTSSSETKSNSSLEIKSEVMSSKGGSVGPLVGLSPPSARTTHQPQNQAVRHIPNPALLFNRQNSTGRATNISPTSEGKPLIFGQKLPLKLDDHALPALPFPGVSVPVQVKVDNDSFSIPIPVLDHIKTEPISKPDKKPVILVPQQSATVSSGNHNLLIAPTPNKNLSTDKKASAELIKIETSNEICKQEEILKIEYTAEDADLDIDVGIETAHIFTSNDNDGHLSQEEEEEKEKVLPFSAETQAKISNASKDETQSEQIENTPSHCLISSNEIKIEHPGDTNKVETQLSPVVVEEEDKTQVDQVQVSPPTEKSEKEEEEKLLSTFETQEEPQVCIETPTAAVKVEEEEEMDTETVPKERQVETELPTEEKETPTQKEKVEFEETSNLMSTPMELQNEELKESPELEMTCEENEKVGNGQTSPEEVEMTLIDDSCPTPSIQVEEILQVVENKSPESQIGEDVEMQCEEVQQPFMLQESNQMEIEMEEEEGELMVTDNSQDVDLEMKESRVEEDAQECHDNQPIILDSPLLFLENPVVEVSPVPVVQEMQADNEDDEAMESQFQSDSKLLFNSNSSNLVPNQISINPEALQVEEKEQVAAAEVVNEPLHIKEASDTELVSPLNNGDQVREVAEEKLMESSSGSQLEMNCPSADTNGIELSNPVTTAAEPHYSSLIHHVEIEEDEGSESKKYGDPDEAQTQLVQLASDKSIIIPAILCPLEEDKSGENCQNITHPSVVVEVVVEEKEEVYAIGVSNIECEENIVEETPLHIDSKEEVGLQSQLTPEDDVASQIEIITDFEENSQTYSEQELESVGLSVAEASSIPAFISATATITTTTAPEITNSVLELSTDSPISSRNSLESPTSPDNLKKMETFEKVAAGLFATAANTINNNNNTSLTINSSSCDISITTTSANDITIV